MCRVDGSQEPVTRTRLVQEHSGYLVNRDHKRAKQRGYLVKVLAKCSKCICPYQATKKKYPFDTPSEKGTRTSSLAYQLQKWALVYFGGVCHRGCTLMCDWRLARVTGAWLVFDCAHRAGYNLVRKKPITKRFETAQMQARMSG